MEYKKLSKDEISKIVLTKEEFLKGAKKNDLFEKVSQSLTSEREKELQYKKDIDYTILSNQTVRVAAY
jgi:hypothetical protein